VRINPIIELYIIIVVYDNINVSVKITKCTKVRDFLESIIICDMAYTSKATSGNDVFQSLSLNK